MCQSVSGLFEQGAGQAGILREYALIESAVSFYRVFSGE